MLIVSLSRDSCKGTILRSASQTFTELDSTSPAFGGIVSVFGNKP
jgi:hypothetical protein